MTRTPTLPLDDKSMWRKAIARTHPDAGGSHEPCVWMQAVRDAVCNGDVGAAPEANSEARIVYEDGRVPFPQPADFEALTRRALDVASEVGGIFAVPLRYLADCRPMLHLAHEERRGASYKRLALIGHVTGMSKSARIEWYHVAENVPLADRHAGHIIKQLKEPAA
jgi:hypothetical protein